MRTILPLSLLWPPLLLQLQLVHGTWLTAGVLPSRYSCELGAKIFFLLPPQILSFLATISSCLFFLASTSRDHSPSSCSFCPIPYLPLPLHRVFRLENTSVLLRFPFSSVASPMAVSPLSHLRLSPYFFACLVCRHHHQAELSTMARLPSDA